MLFSLVIQQGSCFRRLGVTLRIEQSVVCLHHECHSVRQDWAEQRGHGDHLAIGRVVNRNERTGTANQRQSTLTDSYFHEARLPVAMIRPIVQSLTGRMLNKRAINCICGENGCRDFYCELRSKQNAIAGLILILNWQQTDLNCYFIDIFL